MKYITRIGIEPGFKWAEGYSILGEIDEYVDNLKTGDNLTAFVEINKQDPDVYKIKKHIPIAGNICHIAYSICKDRDTRDNMLIKMICLRIDTDTIYYINDIIKELEKDIEESKNKKND